MGYMNVICAKYVRSARQSTRVEAILLGDIVARLEGSTTCYSITKSNWGGESIPGQDSNCECHSIKRSLVLFIVATATRITLR